jgi:3-deoxy-manno-octulosonate cytidylyltransferase (CMP-KDO synthetase)
MKYPKVLGLIPARYASTRFPGKLLEKIGEKSIIQLVYEQALKASSLSEVIIVTDHKIILEQVHNFGGKAVLSNPNHLSGTDRIAEAAVNKSHFDYIINIQGDEPFILPENIDLLTDLLVTRNCQIATLAIRRNDMEGFINPNQVKVLTDLNGRALYFSRAGIPFRRDQNDQPLIWQKHVGIYGFQREVLLAVTQLKESYLESQEKLEQLRWIENGYQIQVGMITGHGPGIDSPEDLIDAQRFAEQLGKHIID